jgi:hypothetical protein
MNTDQQRRKYLSLFCMRSSLVVIARPTANAIAATVLGSIPASSDTVESVGRQMKQCWIQYIEEEENPKKIPLFFYFVLPGFQPATKVQIYSCLSCALNSAQLLKGRSKTTRRPESLSCKCISAKTRIRTECAIHILHALAVIQGPPALRIIAVFLGLS